MTQSCLRGRRARDVFRLSGRAGQTNPAGPETGIQYRQEGQDEITCLNALADELGAPACARMKETAAPAPIGLPTGALTPEKVCLVLAALQPENAIIVDEGLTTAFTYYAASAGAPPHALMAVSGGAIGLGMPCALGAALACPERKVINFQADGSALYTLQALWSQARESVDVTTLVCSNRSYNIVKMELERTGVDTGRTAANALTHLAPPDIDWVRLASGFGVPGVRVENAEDLAAEIRRALASPVPTLSKCHYRGSAPPPGDPSLLTSVGAPAAWSHPPSARRYACFMTLLLAQGHLFLMSFRRRMFCLGVIALDDGAQG